MVGCSLDPGGPFSFDTRCGRSRCERKLPRPRNTCMMDPEHHLKRDQKISAANWITMLEIQNMMNVHAEKDDSLEHEEFTAGGKRSVTGGWAEWAGSDAGSVEGRFAGSRGGGGFGRAVHGAGIMSRIGWPGPSTRCGDAEATMAVKAIFDGVEWLLESRGGFQIVVAAPLERVMTSKPGKHRLDFGSQETETERICTKGESWCLGALYPGAKVEANGAAEVVLRSIAKSACKDRGLCHSLKPLDSEVTTQQYDSIVP
ncbi:uncharacterized protein J3D65DRAFT_661716 [Phyllosticta citribraziliensis]|uniref:Uncharacterized protein n=1 Tax=Phyllosticta citribraziliensis TaxID=989973 RepID=A0ABR1L9J6_9PEZI